MPESIDEPRVQEPFFQHAGTRREIDIVDIARRYSCYETSTLSYATAEDYCDSLDHLWPLATITTDLKDVQRPWVIKAILGSVERGGSVLEIGAGRPFVARILQELGYDVTIVDPYDGSAGGAASFDNIVAANPDLTIVRDVFGPDLNIRTPRSFDCVYSVSVLEHVVVDLPLVQAGIEHFVKPGGWSIHAIDHVLSGRGEDQYRRRLESVVELLVGLNAVEELRNLLAECGTDPETFLMPVYAHNRWRGNRPYAEFPFRRWISSQICKQTACLNK